jgi:phosphatidate phosphatase APP1
VDNGIAILKVPIRTLTVPDEGLSVCRTLSFIAALGFAVVFGCGQRHAQSASPPSEAATPGGEQPARTSDIRRDEEVVFFSTSAHQSADGKTWTLPIHGVVHEPEKDSLRRGALVLAVRKSLDLKPGTPESENLDRRLRLFLVDNESGKKILVRIGTKAYEAGESEPNGHFQATILLAAAEVASLADRRNADGGWLSFEAILPTADRRRFSGRVQLIGPEGLSVISDIDDTIKDSQVGDTRAVLANTFLRKFKPVAGMPELYRRLAQAGAVFHYVSGSPWQLYPLLAEFVDAEGYPRGSFDLKHFRLKDRSMLGLLQSQEATKLRAIEPILAAYPERRFILIGDSGEQDPEIYTKIARDHPGRVAAIFIRAVRGEKIGDERFQTLRKGLQGVRLELFEHPETIARLVE